MDRGKLGMKAVLFVGHGSRLEAGNQEVSTFIEKMMPSMEVNLLIETCFLEFASPNIAQGIDNCVNRGATDISVIPIILLHAGHSKLHIPAEIEEARVNILMFTLHMDKRLEYMKKCYRF